MTNYQDKEERKNIEHQLGSMIQYPNPNLEQPIVTHVSSAKKLSGVWSKLTRYRNDLAHVQMNIDPIDAETLQKFYNRATSTRPIGSFPRVGNLNYLPQSFCHQDFAGWV